MTEFPVTLYHNPACGTSRNVLAILQSAGHEPEVVEYLKIGWTTPQLKHLAQASGSGIRGLLREKNPLVAELDLASASDDQILEAMTAHPELVNRPIVQTPLGIKLCRPAETVLSLLED